MRSSRLTGPALGVATILGLGLPALGQAGSPDFSPPASPAPPRAPARPDPGTDRPTPDRPVTTGGTVDLRPRFTKGQELRYVLEQDSLNKLKSAGGGGLEDAGVGGDQKLNQRLVLVMRVVDSAEAGATIQVVYESIRVRMTTPQGSGEFDSARPAGAPKAPATSPLSPAPPGRPGVPTPAKPGKPTRPTAPADPDDPLANPPKLPTGLPTGVPGGPGAGGDLDEALAQMVGPMVGQTVTVKTDHNGVITGVSGGEGLGGGGGLGGMGATLVPPPSAIANWLVAGAAGSKGSARVGETWTNNDSLAGTPVGSFRMVTQHTLQSAFGGLANARFSGHIEKASEGGPMGLAQVKDSRYSGTYAWDTRAGALKEMSTDLSVAMDANLGGTPAEMTAQSRLRVTRQDAPGGWRPRE